MRDTDVTSLHRFDEIETLLTQAKTGRRDLFSDKDFTARLADRLDRMLDGERILSMDVFDTLVLRDNSSEITRFYEIGGKMADLATSHTGRDIAQVDAFVARHLGTKATYRASGKIRGCREGSLLEIHATASRILTGGGEMSSPFVEAELEYESGRIEPNPFLVDYAARHRARGGRVVLLTDMYMHAEQVTQLLNLLGISPKEYDFLLSSADTKVSKASGGIFRNMQDEMQAAPGEFVHIGDSFRGDVAQPIRQGWQALHLPLAQADILERRRDHAKTASMLRDMFNVDIDIAMPK